MNLIKISSRFFRLAILIFLMFSLLLQGASGHGMLMDLMDFLKIAALTMAVVLVHFYPGIKNVSIKRYSRFTLMGLLLFVFVFLLRLFREVAAIAYEYILVELILLGLLSLLILADTILLYNLLRFKDLR